MCKKKLSLPVYLLEKKKSKTYRYNCNRKGKKQMFLSL